MSHHLPDALMDTLSSHLDLSKSRLQTLAWLVIGLVNSRTVNLSHLACQCSGKALVKSSYRRLQRFFQFVTLDGDWLALVVTKLLRIKGPRVLCLDRTNWKIGQSHVNILVLAVATRRFRVPLMWTVLGKAGNSNQEERIALMQRYLALFGARSISWLLADREFIGEKWISFLLHNEVPFSIRVKEDMMIRLDDGRVHQLKTLLRKPANGSWLRQRKARFETMDESLGFPLRFAAKRLCDGEWLIVVSNGPAKKALKIYRRRWAIECLFGDGKTRGFNMEDTRLTQTAKLNTLLLIVTLAMIWAYACATAVQGRTPVKTLTHGYQYKSWFRIGFDQLRVWIFHQPDKAVAVWRQMWPKRPRTLKSAGVV